MNYQRPWWLAFSLLPPLLVLCALIFPFGCGSSSSSSPTATPTSASIAVAFVGVPPSGNFRNVLLNISGVRLNKTANAATSSPGWVTIAVPSEAGTGNGQNPGDVQIDLMNNQTGAVVFNVGGVLPGDYQTVQILVDQTDPGTVVPACQSGSSNTEGCVNYKMQFSVSTTNPNLNPVVFTLAQPLNASANATTPLVVQLGMTIDGLPATTGDPYIVTITPSETNASSFLATVTGNIKVTGTSSGQLHIAPLTVSAELSGTGTLVESVPIRARQSYTLEVPAAPDGTSYDIFTSGGGNTPGALQNIMLRPGQLVTGQDMTVIQTDTTTLSGVVGDSCTGLGIPGAQLDLLAPAQNATKLPTPRPTPPAPGFCQTQPQSCVIVASANTDPAGNFPIPGPKVNEAGFDAAPMGGKDLALQISASGYNSLLSGAFIKGTHNQVCSASGSPTECNFSLPTGYINGTVNLVTDPPPGNSVMVQVFAENTGTNQLVSALPQPLVFLNHQTSLPFTLNVPINDPLTPFDLFAVAIDPFQGATSPFPGHDITVLANQTAPALCDQVSTSAQFAPMNCVGHGSISGTVQNPDTGTTVQVEKNDPNSGLPVQITGTPPGLFSSTSPSNNQYTLCVPPDSYALQRFEAAPTSTATSTATPIPIGTPQPVMVPQPAATASPCPSTCSNTDGGPEPCPGICDATSASPL